MKNKKQKVLLNEDIARYYSQIILIDMSSKNVGLVDTKQALNSAEEEGLDLLFMSLNKDNQAICKMIDYGRYKYDKSQKNKKNNASASAKKTKEFRFTINISNHDLENKVKRINEFLAKGYPVRIVVKLRGREMGHKDLGFDIANKILDMISEHGKIQDSIESTGNQIFYRMLPK